MDDDVDEVEAKNVETVYIIIKGKGKVGQQTALVRAQ